MNYANVPAAAMLEVVRKLMQQVAEEQKLRREAFTGIVEREPCAAPTDAQVCERIEELL